MALSNASISLRVLARLLSYPDAKLRADLSDMKTALHTDKTVLPARLAELDRIDQAVRRIRVPLNFSDQLYDLRGHIDLVRQRLLPSLAGRPRFAE